MLPLPTGYADGHRDGELARGTGIEVLLEHEKAQLLSDSGCPRRRASRGERARTLHHRTARPGPLPAGVLAEHVRDTAQNQVAHLVPERVVDRLEVVDVDEGDRERPIVSSHTFELREQVRQKGRAIGDPREAIDRRCLLCRLERVADP
jgi:hypothetical protein